MHEFLFKCISQLTRYIQKMGSVYSTNLLRSRPQPQVINRTAKINTSLYFNPSCSPSHSQKALLAELVGAAGVEEEQSFNFGRAAKAENGCGCEVLHLKYHFPKKSVSQI